jgi:hypothetical protein
VRDVRNLTYQPFICGASRDPDLSDLEYPFVCKILLGLIYRVL